jgi:putative DNA primase/helicase
LPGKAQFASAANYYATALHELGHWTGHASRLNRDLAHPFGSVGYAREELRAEITSMILGSELGIGHDPAQHAAYVGSWIKVLTKDPFEIFRAAADAEKIQRFVLGLAQTQDVQQASGQTQAPGAQPSDPSRAANRRGNPAGRRQAPFRCRAGRPAA